MKGLKLSVLLIIISCNLLSLPVDQDYARNVAFSFLEYKNIDANINSEYTVSGDNLDLVYVYNLEPAGFIAVTADTDVYPLLAYSFHQILAQPGEDENPLFTLLTRDVQERLIYSNANPQHARENRQLWDGFVSHQLPQRDFQQWPAAGTTITDGWIETTWTQSGVFNQMCPLDSNGERSVVGCVATAMAMIIDFHGHVGNISFDDSDDYSYGWWNPVYIDDDYLERDFPSFPELNIYLDELQEHYEDGIELTAQDKAALSFACGVSVHMYYSADGSGAWTEEVAPALLYKFGYDSAYWIDNWGDSFYEQLSQNMIEMRPVEISIETASGSGGHAIIVDGYNTDEYYHLNYGWGTSNNTCWYLLPAGMPHGYENGIIHGGVVEIEGGEIPVQVSGYVLAGDQSPVGTHITLQGDKFFECYVTEEDGSFLLPSVLAGTYTATAILESRIYYQQIEDLYIDEDNNYIFFNLGNFECLSGIVSAPVAADNTHIRLYQEDEIKYEGIAGPGGYYTIPDVIPGFYMATASLEGNYFQIKEMAVTLEDQVEDFDLQEFAGNIPVSYASSPAGIWSLGPGFTLSCAIKLTAGELTLHEGDIFAQIQFKSPIAPEEGEIWIQVWEEEDLLEEVPVTDFSKHEWVAWNLHNFIQIDPAGTYYMGYKIHSQTGELAYHDAGPRLEERGAFFRVNSWVELPAAVHDFNFCIEPVIITAEYGSVSGDVILQGGNGEITDVAVSTGIYCCHPDDQGNYELDLKPGNYDITAQLTDYMPDMINDLNIVSGQQLVGNNFVLVYGLPTQENEIVPLTGLLGNYPNPFNPETTIRFTLAENSRVILVVYNCKGQKVRTLIDGQRDSGSHSINWNGRDDSGRKVSSGVYLYS
ncbi:MAG: C10 family peptidase, partial [Candidatus Cloacimonetes bacterium]|nr:C10 family peptidase [Candidatus Cloacimonadota bacterium]